MLSEITAVTQLLLVVQVGYLMHHCRSFKNGIPDVLDDMADRDLRTRTAFGEVASLLDEVVDGLLVGEDEGIPIPTDLKSMLTHALLSRFMPTSTHKPDISSVDESLIHGGTQNEEGEIHEINPPTQNETEV